MQYELSVPEWHLLQNSDIHYTRKIICISQETPTKTRYIVVSAEATFRYIEIFNCLTLKFSYHYTVHLKLNMQSKFHTSRL